jgi:elongation factor P
MIDHTQLKKGARIIMDGTPYEILDSMPMKKAQRRVVIQAKIRNLLNNAVSDQNFHQGDIFEEAELQKFETKYLYTHKEEYFFCDINDPSKRFSLTKEQVGETAGRFFKTNKVIEGLMLDEKIVTITLPIKITLKVKEAPPGIKGERAQAGTKIVVLETGAEINVPLFVEEGDTIEINTETGEYVKRL